MSTTTRDPLDLILTLDRAWQERDVWRERAEQLQRELVAMEIRHREHAAGLKSELDDAKAQKAHWVKVAQSEMARRPSTATSPAVPTKRELAACEAEREHWHAWANELAAELEAAQERERELREMLVKAGVRPLKL